MTSLSHMQQYPYQVIRYYLHPHRTSHQKIIKTISLIYIVEQFEKLPPIYDVIVDAYRDVVGDTKVISNALADLVSKECIVYLKRSNNYLKLKESSGVDIPQEIAKKIESNRATLSVRDILNKSSFDSFMYPKALFSRLLDKMQTYNSDLYNYADEYLSSSRKLLPIVVSGSSSSLTQSFLFALQQALKNENLNDIMPDTHFTASLNAIESWKTDYPDTYKQFVADLGTPIDDFVLSLKEYSVESYEKFIELYPKLTAGSTFNPFLGFDVVELYEKVVDKLADKGYEGVYIVYDEFSKYLESSIGNATISDIKLLQDFAEKCARSGKKQMHLMLICHKDIANYIDSQLPKEKVDGWRGVSGRFKHTNLHNNFAQMYEIISAVIKKDSAFWDTFVDEHKAQFDELESRYTINGLLDDSSEEGIKSAIYGCYPMHPVSTFILPRLSEKVAQNERTLFTFLSSEDKHTLSAFLKTAEGDFPMLTPDYLYDYFEPLFRKEPYTSDIHKTYRLTANILQKVENDSIHARHRYSHLSFQGFHLSRLQMRARNIQKLFADSYIRLPVH